MTELTDEILPVRIPKPLFEEMSRIRKNNGYNNNAEYIRAAIRQLNEKLDGG